MKRILIATLFYFTAISNIAYAETPKSAKTLKSSDTNQTMTDEEFMKKMMAFEQRQKDAKDKTVRLEQETLEAQKKLEATRKLRKTVDELADKLGVRNQ